MGKEKQNKTNAKLKRKKKNKKYKKTIVHTVWMAVALKTDSSIEQKRKPCFEIIFNKGGYVTLCISV